MRHRVSTPWPASRCSCLSRSGLRLGLEVLGPSCSRHALCALLEVCPHRRTIACLTEAAAWPHPVPRSTVCVYGGVPKRDQVAALRKGASIVVATPGRLEDLMNDGACKCVRQGLACMPGGAEAASRRPRSAGCSAQLLWCTAKAMHGGRICCPSTINSSPWQAGRGELPGAGRGGPHAGPGL